ncbi:MAG TPA: MoaD/ThiS family protein [Syntrophorhabdaceae bacterium]|nr:MoaD/ThiS family protein [Syntrophorhabdaceae bacterium]
MHVTVKLFATLRKDRFDIKEVDVPEGTTVGEMIQRVGIPDTEVTLVFINGHHRLTDAKLTHGDTLALFPPIGGG